MSSTGYLSTGLAHLICGWVYTYSFCSYIFLMRLYRLYKTGEKCWASVLKLTAQSFYRDLFGWLPVFLMLYGFFKIELMFGILVSFNHVLFVLCFSVFLKRFLRLFAEVSFLVVGDFTRDVIDDQTKPGRLKTHSP